MAKENFIPEEEEVSWNHNLHVIPTSSISLKPKIQDLLNLSNYKKIHSFVKGDQRNFSSGRKINIFLKNWEKVTNDSTILSIVKGYCIGLLETS